MNRTILEDAGVILSRESEAIRSIPLDGTYEKAVDLLFMQVHEKRGKVIASGMGKAGHVAGHIATTLSSTGTPSLFIHPSEAQHGDLGVIRENDVLLLLSNSGKTREILELVELSRTLHPGIPVILVTGNPEGLLAQKSNLVLHTGSPAEVCPLGLTPTTSATAMTVIGDILVVLLMKKIGFTAGDYARRHHGGYLGKLSKATADEDKRK